MSRFKRLSEKLDYLGIELRNFGLKCPQCGYFVGVHIDDLGKWVGKKCRKCGRGVMLTEEDYKSLMEWIEIEIDPKIEIATKEDIEEARMMVIEMLGKEPELELKTNGEGKVELIAKDYNDFEGRELPI